MIFRRHMMLLPSGQRTLLMALLLVAFVTPSLAQSSAGRGSFVSPFPKGGTYKVFVFGDSLASGLFEGLKRGLRLDPNLRVENRVRPGSRLARPQAFDWVQSMESTVKSEPFDIAVMNFGVNDRVSIRVNGRRYAAGTREWDAAYGKRLDALLKATKAKGAAIYWVGLPVMRGPRASNDAQVMNAIARERVYRHGGKYVDTWEGFTDGDGNFSPYGPDLTGKIRRLRSKDGVYFTGRGYRKLAHFVERIIRRDLALARSERNVPLAGTEAEQRQVRRLSGSRRATQKRAKPGQWATSVSKQPEQRQPAGDFKADHATVRVKLPGGDGKTVQLRIVRPSLPAAVVGHIQRRSRGSRGGQLGRNLLRFEADGLGVLNSVASSGGSGSGGLSSPSLVTQTPYYRALVKGQTLRVKPGRTDDFSWPPQDRPAYPSSGS